jgi:hypothetical protein
MAALLFCLAWALASCGASERAGEEPPAGQSSATEEMTGPTIRPGGEETADPGGASSQPSGGVGEAIALTGFDFRVLDYVSTPEYSYLEAANPDGTTEGEEGISAAGKFVVVTYTARNTGSAPTTAALTGSLETEGGEAYPEAETPKNPNSGYAGLELAPRQLGTGQFIFDVPQDVEPVRLDVGIKYASGQLTGEGATVDLTRQDPQGPTPEEIMALGYTYINMGAWGEFYALLADESKQLVPEKQFVAFFESAEPTGVEGFSFPSVDVQGDRATVRTDFGTSTDGEESEQLTQELVLQEDGWRIVASDEQVEAFTGTVEATQY